MAKKIDTGRFVPERIEEWAYWIGERENVRHKKDDLELKPPYTRDPVIGSNRYCNVRRMDDKVSKWMLDNWFSDSDYAQPGTAIIAALMARMINRTETLSRITKGARFTKFDYDRAYKVMYEIKAEGTPVFTNAYIINGASGGPKIDQVLGAIRTAHTSMQAKRTSYDGKPFLVPMSMQRTAEALHALPGVGSFIAGQVVADLRHVLGSTIDGWWADRMKWAPPGPGSSRGMKYLLGKASAEDMAGRGADLKAKEFLPALQELVLLAQRHPIVGPIFEDRKLEAHDIQNTLCETSKYIRIKYGAGRAKNSYDAQSRYYEQLDL